MIVDRLLTEQMADGGWNCEQEPERGGSTRGSFDTTINVLEGLLEYERATGAAPTSLRRVSVARSTCSSGASSAACRTARSATETGSIPPSRPGWHYNVLRALDYLREAGVTPDERISEAIEIVESKRDADGRWPLELILHDELLVDLGQRQDEPSRWNTLHALRVLRWAEGKGTQQSPAASTASA